MNKFFAFVVLFLGVTSVQAFADNGGLSHIMCRDITLKFKVDVQVDVLESLPPQSQIQILKTTHPMNDHYTETLVHSFSSVTNYAEIETYPVILEWSFEGFGGERLVVSAKTREPGEGVTRAASGVLYLPNRDPMDLACGITELQ